MDKFTVRDVNGSVDVDASVSAYRTALASWVQSNELDLTSIERAVEAVFDEYSESMPMQFVVGQSAQRLGVEPSQFKTVTARITSYVRGQVSLGRFTLEKRKGKGLTRLAKPGEPLPSSVTPE
jgi:hypothetical protein